MAVCNGTWIAVRNISALVGLEPGTARSVGQHLPTELPGLL